ncbi:Clp protease N-terminal domain-containing protein [Streptomyces fenghuangensis]
MGSVHSHTSRQGIAGRGPKVCAALGPGPAAALSSARRRAVRDGDRQVDTAHLLHGLVESDPAVRAALGGTARLTRILGYGLRWRRTVEGATGAAGTATAQETPAAASAGALGWSPAATAALEDALRRARARGGVRVEGTDLLDALFADPCCRAVEVLRRAGAAPAAAPLPPSAPAAARTGARGAETRPPRLCQGHSR